MKPDQDRAREILTQTIMLLCKNGLHFSNNIHIEGILGITVDESDVFIVHIDEKITDKPTSESLAVGSNAELQPLTESSQQNLRLDTPPAVSNDRVDHLQCSEPTSGEADEKASIEEVSVPNCTIKLEKVDEHAEADDDDNDGVAIVSHDVADPCSMKSSSSSNVDCLTDASTCDDVICIEHMSRKRKRRLSMESAFINKMTNKGQSDINKFMDDVVTGDYKFDVCHDTQDDVEGHWCDGHSVYPDEKLSNYSPNCPSYLLWNGGITQDHRNGQLLPTSPCTSQDTRSNYSAGPWPSSRFSFDVGSLVDNLLPIRHRQRTPKTVMCQFAGCGKTFCHSFHLYRHQRAKHGQRYYPEPYQQYTKGTAGGGRQPQEHSSI